MLLFSSTVIFLAIAPLIVLYALGYRLNTSAIDPLPVSVLQVESQPSRATVQLNNKGSGQTPQTISNVPPGPATLTVSKEGYQPWEKSVTLEPGRATEFRDIRLFPTKPNLTVIASNIATLTLAPNRQLLAAIDQKNILYLYDEEGITIGAPLPLSAAPREVLWSPDSASLLLTYRRAAAQVVSVSTRPQVKTLRAAPSSVSSSIWDPRIPGRLLLVNRAQELWAYNHVSDSAELLLKSVTALATTSRSIIVSQTDGSLSFLTLQGQRTTRVRPNLTSPITAIHTTPAGKIALRTSDSHVYYVLSGEQITSVTDTSESLGWSPDGTMLYVQTAPNELAIWKVATDAARWLPTNSLHLVLRLSRPLHDPQWFAGSRHLIYQVADEIHITEIDTRDHPIDYRLDSTNIGTAHATVGRDGNVIFYLKKEGNKTSLLRAQISE